MKFMNLRGRCTFFDLELVELELFSLEEWEWSWFFGSRDVEALPIIF